MFGSQILEVAIGIIFVFLLVSIICSAIREGIKAWLKTRAAFLNMAFGNCCMTRMRQAWQKAFMSTR